MMPRIITQQPDDMKAPWLSDMSEVMTLSANTKSIEG